MFEYEPIDASKQIRLISLATGAGSGAIQIELLTATLDNPPQHETLSYAWGDGRHRVLLQSPGNTSLIVTKSLADALCALHLLDHPRIIWADAVC
jgi:hypothetical protein